jgi:hypothetical protein
LALTIGLALAARALLARVMVRIFFPIGGVTDGEVRRGYTREEGEGHGGRWGASRWRRRGKGLCSSLEK